MCKMKTEAPAGCEHYKLIFACVFIGVSFALLIVTNLSTLESEPRAFENPALNFVTFSSWIIKFTFYSL